jgi:hypothetical protein
LFVWCSYFQLPKSHWNQPRFYSLEEGDFISYKLKFFSAYSTQKIMSVSDSVLILEGATELKLRAIKSIRFNKGFHLLGSFKTFFFGLGIGFFPLNTVNQAITGHTPIIQASAAYISAGLLGAGLILRELGLKRVHINKRVDFKVIDLDFEHLGEKKGP